MVVILAAEMRNLIFVHDPAQGVVQLLELYKQVMLWAKARRSLWALVVERQPLLNAAEAGTLCKVGVQDEVECERRSKNRVAAQEVDLDLHGVAHPANDVDVVPTFFVVATWWVVVDAHLVEHIAVQLGVVGRVENVFKYTEL